MNSFRANNITYTLCFPAYPANLFVDHYVVMRGRSTQMEEKLFPNNKAELFINLGEKVTGVLNKTDCLFHLQESVVSGLRDTYFTFTPGTHFYMAGIRFTLFGFYCLFKMEWLREQLSESRNKEALFTLLHNWVLSKIGAADLQEIRQWKKIERAITQAGTPISELLNKTMGYSHKHSIHLFKEKCGLKPKTIQKVSRFKHILHLLSRKGIAELDYLPYADQSHLIREFKEFTGFTPVQYLHSKPLISFPPPHLPDFEDAHDAHNGGKFYSIL